MANLHWLMAIRKNHCGHISHKRIVSIVTKNNKIDRLKQQETIDRGK